MKLNTIFSVVCWGEHWPQCHHGYCGWSNARIGWDGGGELTCIVIWVLPNDSDLQFPYLKGSEGIHQTKDCHYLKKDWFPLCWPLPQRKLVETSKSKKFKKESNDHWDCCSHIEIFEIYMREREREFLRLTRLQIWCEFQLAMHSSILSTFILGEW